MHAGYELRALAVAGVVLQEQLAGLLVERGFGVGVDEQPLAGDEDVADPVRRLPVLLERVHTDLARRRDVRMEYLRREPAWRAAKHTSL